MPHQDQSSESQASKKPHITADAPNLIGISWTGEVLTRSKHLGHQDSILLVVPHFDFYTSKGQCGANLQISHAAIACNHQIYIQVYPFHTKTYLNLVKHSIYLACSILLEVATSGQHQGPHASAMVAAELVAMPPQLNIAKETCACKMFYGQEELRESISCHGQRL